MDQPLEIHPCHRHSNGNFYHETTPSERTFIHNTLTQHQAFKLHKFSLDFSYGALQYLVANVQLQHDIEFAISRQVQILSVSTELLFEDFEDYYVLPNVFYSHDNVPSLEQVSLKGFLFNPNPPCDLPFASLKALCLFDCVIDDGTLKGLLSNSPVLESLTIDLCHRLLNFKASWCQSMRLKHLVVRCMHNPGFNLEIDSSSLSSFKVYGNSVKISVSLLSSIAEATVFRSRYYPYVQNFDTSTWLRNLAHVKKFGVNSWFSQFLAREYEVNNNGWKIFENLKVFAWFGPLEKECDLIALIDFLVHCPSLEKIEIDFRFSFWEEAGEHRPPFALERPFVENRGDGQPTVGFLDNVKKIIIHHFFGYKSEIEFIKHLMQKAVVLETLSLTYRRLEFNPESFSRGYTSCPPKELVQEEIFSLSTASSNVHISFHHTYHKLGF
ncbi:hypothetical protein ERO13_A05G367500v2 [Gossypium hirsutum]|uniref:At1g61320/AtMIF1 LRR domain-containing protein n=1 Tax=Gossypium tomentosum TaxID=34277 RepID=A0A5D2QRF1_GOSTO|nr:hypothetical protein ERO13_A05G367500v2 [Gossypium hirsutum]TYI30818.1 hypothetical protein ES332_A05G413700v1 [Gossypium tomentosum]